MTSSPNAARKTRSKALWLLIAVLGLVYAIPRWLLPAAGQFLVAEDPGIEAEAIVVLSTGVDHYPRLIEAAALYAEGRARRIVINGDRKTDVLRDLERRGFEPACPWYEDDLRVLELLGIPREDVLPIPAEDAYDTVSEARMVGDELLARGIGDVLIATSKFHTRRARFVWRKLFARRMSVGTAAARSDPFDPEGWWRDARQVRWVIAEYGAWIYDVAKTWGEADPVRPPSRKESLPLTGRS